jgi:PAS domain S-box-containing protein
MPSDWKWNTLEPIERKIAELLVQGKSNAAICEGVFLSRPRVQEYIKRILVKTGTCNTREAIALLVHEKETQTLLSVLEHARAGIVIIQDNLVKYINPALAEVIGYDPEEVVDVCYEAFMPERQRGKPPSRYERESGDGSLPEDFVVTILCKGGEEKRVVMLSAGVIQYRGKPALLATGIPIPAD